MRKTNERGVTLVVLVTTIITLLILSTIGVTSGKSAIEYSNFNKLKSQLTILQTKVNELNQQNKTDIGQEISNEQKAILNNEIVSNIIYKDITEEEKNTIEAGFRLLNGNQIKEQLGLDGYKGNYLINVEYRYVVLCEGLEYNGTTYYMIDQMEDGLYNVEYHNKNSDSGTFEVNTITEGDKCKVEITDINYDGYVSDWQVKYKLNTSSQWNTSDELNFYVRQQGVYDIKVVHGDEIELETKTLTIVFSDIFNEIVKSGFVEVGDYVQYSPDLVNSTEYNNLISEFGTYSGSTSNTTSTLKQDSLNWRILDVTDDGQVRLISDGPTTSKVTLSGAKGYNNAVYLLDKTCDTLYNNPNLASKVQNLKIEDIQNCLTYDYTQFVNSNVDTGKYGGTKIYTDNRYYPNIFAKEKTGWVDEKQGTELGLSEQIQLIDETKTQAKTNIKITQTYWSRIVEENEFKNSIYYNLFINNGKIYSTYWMSSHCVNADPNRACFCIRYVSSGGFGAGFLYYSDGKDDSRGFSFRPVITLNSDVQLDINDTTKDGTSASKAWIIKD